MKYIYLALNWVFGLFFGLTGVMALFESPLAGISFVLISMLLLPPIRNIVYGKIQKKLSFAKRALSIFVLFIVGGMFLDQPQERSAAEKEAQQAEDLAQDIEKVRQENINYFNENRGEIISSALLALSESNYQLVMIETNKYLPANDGELNEINAQAKNVLEEMEKAEEEAEAELAELQRQERTEEILAELRTIPASELHENKTLYAELLDMHPDNTTYQEKFDYYFQKIYERIARISSEQGVREKEARDRVARFGEAPEKSAWDGSYYAVESYLKRVANDPDSIDIDSCTKTYRTENGWLVGCDYRGRNAFGGMIRQSNWFTIVHGQVTQMHDASAYNP